MNVFRSFILICLIFNPITFSSAKQKASFKLESSYSNKYVWNGADLNHGDPVLAQFLAINFGSFLKNMSLSFWTSFGLSEDPSLGDTQDFALDEFDTLLGYFITWNKKVSSYIEMGWFYWTSDFFSNFGADRHDFEIASYHSFTLSPLSSLGFNYKRGIDRGIRGNVFELLYTLKKQLSKKLSITPELKATASSQYLEKHIFSQLVLALPLNFTIKNCLVSLGGQYLYIPNYQKLFQDNAHDFIWSLKLGYNF